jgi:hypothetical protein
MAACANTSRPTLCSSLSSHFAVCTLRQSSGTKVAGGTASASRDRLVVNVSPGSRSLETTFIYPPRSCMVNNLHWFSTLGTDNRSTTTVTRFEFGSTSWKDSTLRPRSRMARRLTAIGACESPCLAPLVSLNTDVAKGRGALFSNEDFTPGPCFGGFLT